MTIGGGQAATGETDRPNRQEMAGNRSSCSILRGVRQADSATTRTNEKGLGELPPSPEDVPEAANPRGGGGLELLPGAIGPFVVVHTFHFRHVCRKTITMSKTGQDRFVGAKRCHDCDVPGEGQQKRY